MTLLKIIFSDSGAAVITNVDCVLGWRRWSEHEVTKIAAVANGNLRRLSTDLMGRPCDIELSK